MADLGDGTADKAPLELATVRDDLLRQLYDNRTELKGIALVQGLKAIASLVGLDDGEEAGEVSYTLPELLADVNLPPERKTELLTIERDHLQAQLTEINQALGDEDA